MTDFVLVHGFGGGGWCWRQCADLMAAAGHRVFTPTLSGVGDRAHLLGRHITLSTHVADVASLIEWEELNEVVLVGHSYGGAVVSGAADRVRERLATLVYLDAFVLGDGDSVLDLQPPERREFYRRQAAENGFGWLIPPPPSSFWKLARAVDVERKDRLATPHPLACLEERLVMHHTGAPPYRRAYIWARGFTPSPFQALAARAREADDWLYREIDSGHMTMLDDAPETARLLIDVATCK